MGMFWLMAGVMSLRWGTNGEGAQRTSVVAGVVGIVAGALVLARFFVIDVLGNQIVYVILGALIGLIGLVHVLEGVVPAPIGFGSDVQRHAVGCVEIGLGLVLLLWREEFSPIFYAVGEMLSGRLSPRSCCCAKHSASGRV